MASNFRDFNGDPGDRLHEQDVKSRSFNTPRQTRATRDPHSISQKYPPRVIGSQVNQGYPTEMESTSGGTRNPQHPSMTDGFSRRQDQYPAGGRDQQYPAGGRNQQYPAGGRDQQYPAGGRDQQYSAGGRDQQYPAGGRDQQYSAGGRDQQYPAGGRDQQYPTGGRDQHLAGGRGQRSTGGRVQGSTGGREQFNREHGMVPNQYTPDIRSSFTPHPSIVDRGPGVYNTEEQVQYLANQMNEIIQKIGEIKEFAGLINDISFKVEQVIHQNNELRDVVDDIQFDVSAIKSQASRLDITGDDRHYDVMEDVIRQPDQFTTNLHQNTGHHNAMPFVSNDTLRDEQDDQSGPQNPVMMSDRQFSTDRQLGLSEERHVAPIVTTEEILPTRENEESVTEIKPSYTKPTMDDRQTAFQTENNGQSEIKTNEIVSLTSGSERKVPSVTNTDSLLESGTNIERREHVDQVNVGTEISMQTIGSLRQYKCKRTHQSDDNRINYYNLQEEEVNSELEEEMAPVVMVAPQPRSKSPEVEIAVKESKLSESEPKGMTPSMNTRNNDELTESESEGEIEVVAIKEDQYLEQLALSENFRARDCLDPKSSGADTVFCIDTSDSMSGKPFQQSIGFITKFIEYVEMWATDYQIEENIAIVHFGSEAKIVQQLTNDYSKVREALETLKTGGPTPMMTGLVVSMSALFNRGGPVTVHNRQINPRVILLSDGNATDHRIFEGRDIIQPRGLSKQLIRDKLEDFAERVKLENRYIVSIPVGRSSCLEVLRPLAETTGGYVSSLDDVWKLSRAFFVEVLISQTRYEGITEDIQTNRQEIAAIARSLQNGKDLTENEMNELVTKVIQETAEQIEIDKIKEAQRSEIDEESEMEVGLRVRRGKDWMWGDQDGNSTGTVIGHKSRGYVRVKWDCGNVGKYRHGAQNAYDLDIVDEPRMLPNDVLIAEGVYVRKGKDWEWEEQDGGEDAVGCVYHFEDEGIVHVRWENGIRGNYRFGGYGKIDLDIITPEHYYKLKRRRQKDKEQGAAGYQSHEGATSSNIQTDGPSKSNIEIDRPRDSRPSTGGAGFEQPSESNISRSNYQQKPEETSNITSPSAASKETTSKGGLWQYNINSDWKDYSEEDNNRIEKLYTTMKQGTLIVSINDENCRVIPHKMKQKNTKTGIDSVVRRKEV